MYVVVAENHDLYESWLDNQFVYVGDKEALDKINPSEVKKIIYLGDYSKHPIYFSDDFLAFQFRVAAAGCRRNSRSSNKWWKKLRRGLDI